MYINLWSTLLTTIPGSTSSTTAYSPSVRGELDEQTRANYHRNAKKMLAILRTSTDPRVLHFKNRVKQVYPNFTDEDIAENFGLAVSLLHNCKHGATSDDPKLVEKITLPGEISKALKTWRSFGDKVLLDLFEAFQEAIL